MSRIVTLLLALAASVHGASIADRIVGGSDAPEGAYPYQILLRVPIIGACCGGSIINEQWMLTAAHCIMPFMKNSELRFSLPMRLLTVVVGTNHVNKGGARYRIKRLIAHPGYVDETAQNDVGLIQIDGRLDFGDKVQPVALPTADFTKSDYPAVVSGWGSLDAEAEKSPNELQHIQLTVIDHEVCKAIYEDVTDTNICTLTTVGEGVCHGDSGGPLVADGVQVGIVSWGTPCAVGKPDVYTRVWSYMDWINEYVN